MSNPYLDPHADDDILAPKERPANPKGHHSLDGSPCGRCGGRTHKINMPKNVPPSVLDSISDLLDKIPDNAVADEIVVMASTPQQHDIVASFGDFIADTKIINLTGPMIRAMAEVLDEMTNGEIMKRYRLYAAEREILVVHTILKSLNSVAESLKAVHKDANKIDTSPVLSLVDTMIDSTLARLGEAQNQYRQVCENIGVKPDEDLLTHGSTVNYSDIGMITMVDWLKEGVRRLTDGESP